VSGAVPFEGVKGVLFDFDGTIADTAPDLAGAANAMRRARDLPDMELTTLRPFASQGARGLIGTALGVASDNPAYDSLRSEFLDLYEQNLCTRSRLFDGIDQVIGYLQAQAIPWGIVTNKAARFTVPLVGLLGLKGAAAVVSGDSTAHTKPHPAPLLLAARQLDVPASACIYIGDDERDIVAGQRAGMRTVAAAYGYCAQSDPRQWRADAIIDVPVALLALIAV
jgi:N-acetyl-D-muramate 6-phosphate phosphatase